MGRNNSPDEGLEEWGALADHMSSKVHELIATGVK
jgi:hypothetical protein